MRSPLFQRIEETGNQHGATYECVAITSKVIEIHPMVAYPKSMTAQVLQTFGQLLRHWRQFRRLSQLNLATEANVSARHLSFIETGRAQPSREMVLLLSNHLDLPLRSRNRLLNAAGFTDFFPEKDLDDPSRQEVRDAVETILHIHLPSPALAMDRHWNLVAHNSAVPYFLREVHSSLLEPPINLIRLALHPDGLAKHIINLDQLRQYHLMRLRRQIQMSDDPVLEALLHEATQYSVPLLQNQVTTEDTNMLDLILPLKLRTQDGVLSFLTSTMVFGAPKDITLSELAIETFFAADHFTANVLKSIEAST